MNRWPIQKTVWFALAAGMAGWVVIGLVAWLVSKAVHASPVILPPVQYDHPFAGRLIVETLALDDVKKACRGRVPSFVSGRGQYIEACAWTFPDNLAPAQEACHEILPLNPSDQLIRHEQAHCSGWPANHPGGTYP